MSCLTSANDSGNIPRTIYHSARRIAPGRAGDERPVAGSLAGGTAGVDGDVKSITPTCSI
jgi:hypothetical protein